MSVVIPGLSVSDTPHFLYPDENGEIVIPWRPRVTVRIEQKELFTWEQTEEETPRDDTPHVIATEKRLESNILPLYGPANGLLLRDGALRWVQREDISDDGSRIIGQKKYLEFNMVPTGLGTRQLSFYLAQQIGVGVLESHTVRVESPFYVSGGPDPFEEKGDVLYLRHPRTDLIEQVVQAVIGTTTRGVVLLYGPTCSGKSTLLESVISELKATGSVKLVEITPTKIMEAKSEGEIWKWLDAAFRAAFISESASDTKPMPGHDCVRDIWEKIRENPNSYEGTKGREFVEQFLESKSAELSGDSLFVIVIDELDRIAARAPDSQFVGVQKLLRILINDVLRGLLKKANIRGVLLLADWMNDIKKRWPDFENHELQFCPIPLPYFTVDDTKVYVDRLFKDLVSDDSHWKSKIASMIHKNSFGNPAIINALLRITLEAWLKAGLPCRPRDDFWTRELSRLLIEPGEKLRETLDPIASYMVSRVVTRDRGGTRGGTVETRRLSAAEERLLSQVAYAASVSYRSLPKEGIAALENRGLIKVITDGESVTLSVPLLKDSILSELSRRTSGPRRGRG